MARSHKQDTGNEDTGNGSEFKLQRGAMDTIESKVQTLKFEAGPLALARKGEMDKTVGYVNVDDEYVVNPARLKDANGKYLYRVLKSVPMPRTLDEDGKAITVTAENIGALVEEFVRMLDAYDAATTIVVPRKLKDGTIEEVSGQRTVTLCMDSEADPADPADPKDTGSRPCSGAEYVYRMIRDAATLSPQKRFYRPLRQQAIADFRKQDEIDKPATKTRTKKQQAGEDEEVAA